jgi:predicted transposase YbfD/YdcC
MQYSATTSTGASVTFAIETLPKAFATVRDPRRKQGTRYSVAAILSLAVVAVLANHTSVLAIAQWAERQTRHVRRALGFHRDLTPHQTTIQRLFARLDPAAVAAAVQRVFDPSIPGEIRPRGSQGVALDGKAQRGRLRHSATPTHPIHAVTAFCQDLSGVLAQLVVDAQQHEAEVTLAPQAIRQIDWQGRVLTGDALYCQQALCRQVVEAGGDYLMIVKDNQPTLLADIQQVFAPLTAEDQARTGVPTVHPLPMTTYQTVEKGHGRIEERQIRVSSDLAGYSSWPYLEQVFEYTRRWTVKGVSKQQVRYGITSLPSEVGDAAGLAALKRGHWQVENALHYVKDVTLGEDASQTHVGSGADVFAMVRNIAISLIRRSGHRDIAAQLRRYSGCPREALALLGIQVEENA